MQSATSVDAGVERDELEPDSARGFGDWRVFDEKSLPDEIGLLGFTERPVVLRRDGRGAKKFGFEIVIGEELVDTPERKFAEGRGEKVGVDVDDGRGSENFGDCRWDLRGRERNAVA